MALCNELLSSTNARQCRVRISGVPREPHAEVVPDPAAFAERIPRWQRVRYADAPGPDRLGEAIGTLHRLVRIVRIGRQDHRVAGGELLEERRARPRPELRADFLRMALD